jgi:homoserine dehydrogenase
MILKFGSSVLRNEDDLSTVVHEIYRWWRAGHQVIAVVSAFGNTTDELTRRAHRVCKEPNNTLLASFLATGEAASSALLGLALNKAGITATVLDAVQAGFRTVGPTLDADLVAVDLPRLLAEVRRAVVVLPGFVGRGRNGETTLLGRGGSDLTALFLAERLHGSCVLVKDVDGLYTSDPNSPSHRASRFTHVSYHTAERVGGSVVQLKAVRFAETHRLRFTITSVGASTGTEVGGLHDQIAVSETPQRPVRVALLGCGTVGGGVYERLTALPHLFTVVGVGTRNVERAINADVPVRLITTHLDTLIEKPVDVVIELLGGTRTAASLVRSVLRLGRDVVTANKALLASDGFALQTLATENRARLRYSAAVGGALPALETVRRAKNLGSVRAISGVLNGTTTFILDRIAAGATFNEAVQTAQERGYAEADPQFDLNGADAAHKLILLARAAFDIELPFAAIPRQGIEQLDEANLRRAKERGRTVRLVAECRRVKDGLTASVAPVELKADNPLARASGVENCLLVQPAAGSSLIVFGQGAGRWPTTEAVMADLLDLRREPGLTAPPDEEECVA